MTTKMISVDQATEAIQKLNHRRFSTSIEELQIVPSLIDGDIKIDVISAEGRQMGLDPLPERALLRSLGIGRRFLRACKGDVDLAARALEQGKVAAKEDGPLTVNTIGENRIVAIANSKVGSSELPNLSEVWRTIRDGSEGIIGLSDITDVGRGKFDLRVVTSENFQPKRSVGDITHTGVRVQVTDTSLSVNPYAFRLACLNGMQRMEEDDQIFIDVSDPYSSLVSSFATARRKALEMTEQFVRTDEVVIPNPHEYVMRALRIAGANNNLRSTVSDRIAAEAPNHTLYEILNIITAIGREAAGDKPAKRNRVEALAGRVLSMQAGSSRCTKCDSVV